MGKLAYAAPLDTPVLQRTGIAALTQLAFAEAISRRLPRVC